MCQDRMIVFLVQGYFNKSILLCYIINNNLIKKPKILYRFISLSIILCLSSAEMLLEVGLLLVSSKTREPNLVQHDGPLERGS